MFYHRALSHLTSSCLLPFNLFRRTVYLCALVWAALFFGWLSISQAAQAQATGTLVITTAASYETTAITPDAIVAAFGTNLATFTSNTEFALATSLPLPKNLAGTTVQVNGQTADLFYVSNLQINFAIPSAVTAGIATVTVQNSNGVMSSATIEIKRAAPSIFTANQTGTGPLAAQILRVRANGEQIYEPVSQIVNGQIVTRPLDLGPVGERVFLVMYLCGIRNADNPNGDNNVNEGIRVLIGGQQFTPDYAGQQGQLVGLDQINIELPRTLIGLGKLNIAVSATGYSTSKICEMEVAPSSTATPPVVSGFGSASALAGQSLNIMGAGFSPVPTDNTVRIAGTEAEVNTATSNQVTVTVPFGVETGAVSILTPQGEGISTAMLPVTTSVSGFIEDTQRQPMAGVKVRMLGTSLATVTTNEEGLFVLPDPPANISTALIEIDASTVSTPPFPQMTLKKIVRRNRDNQFEQHIAMQQVNGPGLPVGTAVGNNPPEPVFAPLSMRSSSSHRSNGSVDEMGVSLNVPSGSARLPDGTGGFSDGGTIFLTVLENSRTPVELPLGFFSSVIAQITPFGGVLEKGTLTFPNPDNLPANSKAKLFFFDQRADSATIGEFIEVGSATVSSDGTKIVTDNDAVRATGCYFVAVLSPVTTVIGKVLDSDGRTPVRRALVRVRGREGFTDGNGGFILRGVPVKPLGNDPLIVEVSFTRPTGRIEKQQSSPVNGVRDGITIISPNIILPSPSVNRPPVILAPFTLKMNEGDKPFDARFSAFDRDKGQTVNASLTGPAFASIVNLGNGVSAIRLAPGFNDAGTHRLTLTATDNLGASASRLINVTVFNINRSPVANAQNPSVNEDSSVGITLTGSDADGDTISYGVLTNPANGVLSGTAPNLTYTPNANFNGADSFTFRVNDGQLNSATATVSITVNQVNDAPVLTVPGAQIVREGSTLSFSLSASDIDVGQTLSFSSSNIPAGATLNAGNGGFSWTPGFTQAGTYLVSFTVTDNGVPALNHTRTVSVTVHDVIHDFAVDPADLTFYGADGDVTPNKDPGDALGRTVAIGDLNGDGINDLVMGAPLANNATVQDCGRVYIFFGALSDGEVDLQSATPDVVLIGQNAGDLFGSGIAIGDINGDGRNDLVVSAPRFDVPDKSPRLNAGRVYVVFGNLNKTVNTIDKLAGWIINGAQEGDQLGTALSTGFVFGSRSGKFCDLMISAPFFDPPAAGAVITDAGRVYFLSGGTNRTGTLDLLQSPANFTLTGNGSGDLIGQSVAAGDFNSDGFDDVAVSAPAITGTGGLVRLTYGSSSLNGNAFFQTVDQDALIEGRNKPGNLGTDLAFGDINGDGKTDLAMSDPNGNGPAGNRLKSGEVQILFGRTGLKGRIPLSTIPANMTVYGPANNDERFSGLGVSLAMGDFTGDGIADIAMGDPAILHGRTPINSGAVFVLFGDKALSGPFDLSLKPADLTVYGEDNGDLLGSGGLAIGDIKGKKPSDLVIGIPLADSVRNARINAGEVKVLFGRNR